VFTQVNVEGTRNVVEAALAAGVERFVYTSTMDVLVQTADVPFDEPVIDASPCPTPYQRSEQEGNRIVTAALDRGLPAVFLYPSGVYGEAPFLAPGLNDLLVRLAKRDVPVLLPGRMSVVYTATTSLARSCRGSCRCRSPESPRGPVGSARPGRAGLELDAVRLGPRPHAGAPQATTLDLNRGH
jgi:nucleoside-diphosphate-sugar epimerase